ncbi:LamG domain-containing protein [Candidatus Poribacteria bacterium]|nr:LamG domain-containing protein [Candidatus Poribacteria bacterium]
MCVHNAQDISKVILISLLITMLSAVSGYSKIPEGLVLYLSFDEGSGKVIKDLSDNGNDGENHGAKWVEGKYSKALEYSGVDSWITVPDTPALNFGPKDSLTAQCWGKITGPPSGQGNLLAKYAVGAGTTPFYGMFHNANNKLHAYIRDAGGTAVEPWSIDVINDDKWHHFALVRDSEKKKVYLYVDGNKDFEGADTTSDLSNNVPLAIGRHTGEFLRGMVDEVMVWRKALSEEEVKKSMEPADKLFAVYSLTKLAATWGSIKKQ